MLLGFVVNTFIHYLQKIKVIKFINLRFGLYLPIRGSVDSLISALMFSVSILSLFKITNIGINYYLSKILFSFNSLT
jgi:hypothetical protein